MSLKSVNLVGRINAIPSMLQSLDLGHILVMMFQSVVVAVFILTLFRYRKQVGMGGLYMLLGLMQVFQVLLASSSYFIDVNGLMISPGSTVVFSASLFAVLLVYIKEDVLETRRLVAAVILINIVLSLLIVLLGLNGHMGGDVLSTELTKYYQAKGLRTIIVGSLTLMLDVFLLLFLYEKFARFIPSLFLRILLTMLVVLSLDSLIYNTGMFWETDNYGKHLLAALVSKNTAALIYTLLFYLYLRFVEKDRIVTDLPGLRGIFNSPTYRQKYELATQEKVVLQQKAEKAEELSKIRYQEVVNCVQVGVFQTSPEGFTTYVNPKWCEISGLSQEEALGYGWLNSVHPDDRVQTSDGWRLAAQNGASSTVSYRFLRADGSCRWVLGQAVPELAEDGTFLGYVGTITDITPLKQYEEALNVSKERAEESDRLKSAFLQNISHEIRTPMNAICGFTELLAIPDLSPDKRDSYIGLVQHSANQLLGIVNDIVTISSLEKKQVEPQYTKVNINEVLDDLESVFTAKANERGLLFQLEKNLDDQNALLLTDKTKLTQILTNLVANAFKFTHKGYIRVGYTPEGSLIRFYVMDSGIGVQPKAQQEIFERFRQADQTIQVNYGGTGLGLSISKGLVELMGGYIWVISEPGKGSTFYFILPFNV